MFTPATINIKNFCSPLITKDDVWKAVVTSAEKCIDVLKRRYEILGYCFDFKSMPFSASDAYYTTHPGATTYEEDMNAYISFLLSFCKGYGYDPNLELVDGNYTKEQTAQILQREAESIVWKIQHKGSTLFYEYVFKLYDFIGQVYILLLQNNTSYVRALNWTDYELLDEHGTIIKTVRGIDTEVKHHTWGTPFVKLTPYVNMSDIFLKKVAFDEGSMVYDEDWYFDQYLDTLPTPHMAIEYVADRLFSYQGTEAISIPALLAYIRKSVDYGRKATVVPHIGVQLSFPIKETFFYDFLSGAYSVEALKTNCAVTRKYANYSDTSVEYMDEATTREMDEALERSMDLDGNVPSKKTTGEIFYEMAIGNRKKPMMSRDFPDVNKFSILHCPLDSASRVRDYSTNGKTFTITGTPGLTLDGWCGKAWALTGSQHALSTSTIASPTHSYSMSFWVNANLASLVAEGDAQVMLDWENCHRFSVKATSGAYRLVWAKNYAGLAVETEIPITNLNGLIQIQIAETTPGSYQFDLYYNNVRLSSLEHSVTLSGSGGIAIGATTAGALGFKGKIGEVRIESALFTDAERAYLFSSKIGTTYSLWNELNRVAVSIDNVHETENTYSEGELIELGFRYVAANFPAFECSEVLGVGSTILSTYDFTISEYPVSATTQIQERFTKLVFVSGSEEYVLTDNLSSGFLAQEIKERNGEELQTRSFGTIDYNTGAVALRTYFDHLKAADIVMSAGPAASVLYTLTMDSGVALKPSTVKFSCLVSSAIVTAADDGHGTIVGDHITSGTINYETGEISISYDTSVTNIRLTEREERYSANPDNGTNIRVRYKVDDPEFLVTEAAVIGADGDATIYATFPQVRFNDNYDHLNLNFIIKNVG